MFTKDSLSAALRRIAEAGWVESHKPPGNDGAVGNHLEQLLGIEENNLQLANAGDWELKAQRQTTASLVTLFHMDAAPHRT